MIEEITNYKAIFFDFDDTLCIHSRRARKSDEQYNAGVVSGSYFWQDCSINQHMKQLIDIAKKYDIPMYLISATCSAVHANAKVDWVAQNYGVTMGNYCVGKRKDKLEMLKAYCETHSRSRDKVLFIDDCWDSLHDTELYGFDSCSPMEVVNYIEDYEAPYLLN
jgi:hypothetical protein